jgi:hypothetical protein
MILINTGSTNIHTCILLSSRLFAHVFVIFTTFFKYFFVINKMFSSEAKKQNLNLSMSAKEAKLGLG